MTDDKKEEAYVFSRDTLEALYKDLQSLQAKISLDESKVTVSLKKSTLKQEAQLLFNAKKEKIEQISTQLELIIFDIDALNKEYNNKEDKHNDSVFYENLLKIEKKIGALISDLNNISFNETRIVESINKLNRIVSLLTLKKQINYGESLAKKVAGKIETTEGIVKKLKIAVLYYGYTGHLSKAMYFLENMLPPLFWLFTTTESIFNLINTTIQYKQVNAADQTAEELKKEVSLILVQKSIGAKTIIAILNTLTFAAFAGIFSSPVGIGMIALNGFAKWYDSSLYTLQKADEAVKQAEAEQEVYGNLSNLTNEQQAESNQASKKIKHAIEKAEQTKTIVYWQLVNVIASALIASAPIPFIGIALTPIGYTLLGVSSAKLFYEDKKPITAFIQSSYETGKKMVLSYFLGSKNTTKFALGNDKTQTTKKIEEKLQETGKTKEEPSTPGNSLEENSNPRNSFSLLSKKPYDTTRTTNSSNKSQKEDLLTNQNKLRRSQRNA